MVSAQFLFVKQDVVHPGNDIGGVHLCCDSVHQIGGQAVETPQLIRRIQVGIGGFGN